MCVSAKCAKTYMFGPTATKGSCRVTSTVRVLKASAAAVPACKDTANRETRTRSQDAAPASKRYATVRGGRFRSRR